MEVSVQKNSGCVMKTTKCIAKRMNNPQRDSVKERKYFKLLNLWTRKEKVQDEI